MSQGESDEVSRLDDFEVMEQRRQVMTALAILTDKYKRLNDEMTKRDTLRWMVAPQHEQPVHPFAIREVAIPERRGR